LAADGELTDHDVLPELVARSKGSPIGLRWCDHGTYDQARADRYDKRIRLRLQYNETMGKWLALASIALATGCNYGAGTFHCTDDNQCGAAGRCEPGNLCSSPSPTCESGRAYSDLSGPRSGQCVEGSGPGPAIDSGIDAIPIDAIPIDAPPDVPPDATACFGTDIVRICLANPPTQPLTISDFTVVDTDDTAMCAALTSGGDYCVIAATTLTINNDLRATGARPLVLLATDSITTTSNNTIDVGSHRTRDAGTPEVGAGANPAVCAAITTPTNGGGGAGGSFAGAGGLGGNGNGAAAGGGVPGLAVAPITELRGGCPGQGGAGSNPGAGGQGGGAVFLIAGVRIDVAGGINAAGESGTGGARSTSGAGGGGSGGMIGFDAPLIIVSSLILANGGGGGEGSSQNNTTGRVGNEPITIAAAAGGAGNTGTGGDGGAGSAGAAAGPGAMGLSNDGGGGGGGGGAGIIKAPATASLGSLVSPLATP
jgi:hypothetical protein